MDADENATYPLFAASQLAGYVGVLTGMRKGKISVPGLLPVLLPPEPAELQDPAHVLLVAGLRDEAVEDLLPLRRGDHVLPRHGVADHEGLALELALLPEQGPQVEDRGKDFCVLVAQHAAESLQRLAGARECERDTEGRVVNRADGIAWVGSATVSNEDAYLITKTMRAMGLVYIDHQARI